MRRCLRAVPGDGALETFAERRPRLEPEQLPGTRGVERTARLPVRHRRVPDDLSREAGRVGDGLGELADGGLDAGAEVDRLGAVVALRREHQPLDAVVDVEELAAR